MAQKSRFAEEEKPCGELKKLSAHRLTHGKSSDLSELMCTRVKTHPWFIVIWEKLPIKAPPMPSCPSDGLGTKLYCCYINTVIAYKYPYKKTSKESRSLQEWGRCKTKLSQEDIVVFEDELFKVYPASAVYCNEEKSYWMIHVARRQDNAKEV